MKTHQVTGGGGVRLHAVETGNPSGRPILFIHGFSQSWLAWTRQLESDLADTFRLVALDLRGHGFSDKPRDAYGDSKLWADDIHAVIQKLELAQPVLVGWSYGPLVILDYIRHYGEDAIRGAAFVGGITKLGSEEAAAVLTAEFVGAVPGFFSNDVEQSVRTADSLLRLCFEDRLTPQEHYQMLGYNMAVPPYVRQGLLSRALNNDDLLPKLRKPVLVVQGADDPVVKPIVIEQQMARIPRAQVRIVPKAGHACFWLDAPGYNRWLREFVGAL
ncbi:MAG TPA: alpha/beta hydrolase [Steroidobacteraceae bacterium]|nr:alpha/beta hydrolase [Steroidobacteraceae bacterium]